MTENTELLIKRNLKTEKKSKNLNKSNDSGLKNDENMRLGSQIDVICPSWKVV